MAKVEGTKAETSPRTPAFKLKMSAAVAAYTKGKPIVSLKLPLIFTPGQRLWMVEFAGAPTGRADLCAVIGNDGNLLVLDRRMCWQHDKLDDDLSCVSLTVSGQEFPMVTAAAIPNREEEQNVERGA